MRRGTTESSASTRGLPRGPSEQSVARIRLFPAGETLTCPRGRFLTRALQRTRMDEWPVTVVGVVVVLVALAGCSGPLADGTRDPASTAPEAGQDCPTLAESPVDVRIHNSHSAATVRVTVAGENGTLVDEDRDVARNETAFVNDLPVTTGEYNLTVSTATAVESFDWRVEDGCDRLVVTIREDGDVRIQYAPNY